MPSTASKGLKNKFILPFATLGTNRHKEFPKNTEMASILYLAESDREKGESQLFRTTDEKIVFITEMCYPIWLVPQNTVTVLFDGLGLTSQTVYYDVPPNIEIFNKDLNKNKKTTEAYTAALARNTSFFQDFKERKKVQIEGLIANDDLKKDLNNYLSQMKEVRKPLTTNVILTPKIKSDEIRTAVKQLSSLKKRNEFNIKNMEASMKLLNATTSRRIKAIRHEIKSTQENYHRKSLKTKLSSARRIRQIQDQYGQKITRTSKRFKGRLFRLNKNQVKLTRTLKRLRTEAKRCETKLRSSKRRNRRRTEIQWRLRLRNINKKLPDLRKKIEENSKRIQEVERAQKLEVAKQRVNCFASIESVTKRARDLQSSCEAEMTMKRQEIVTLEEMTSTITKSMQEMIQKKKGFYAELNNLTSNLRKRARRLVYIPFYLARFEKREKKRYVIYPPSSVGDMGILTKMKGVFGAARVKAMLQFRSEALTTFLNQFIPLLEKEPLLEKRVTEAGIQNSILLRKQLRVGIKKGLKELEEDNWISKKEAHNIGKLLYIYSSSMNRRTKALLISGDENLKCLPA